ncbi:protein of unknown function [Methylocella tundrae]|uniref:Uncharacterized protein n=1 Tax=Methylocella tundrae TaxID=227605 RepID=A0A4U8Z4W6_METTU|nr:protein of unknown function [Methylocella tundrae]
MPRCSALRIASWKSSRRCASGSKYCFRSMRGGYQHSHLLTSVDEYTGRLLEWGRSKVAGPPIIETLVHIHGLKLS